jgi:hypothetical protein
MSLCKECGSIVRNPYHGLCNLCLAVEEQQRTQRTTRREFAPFVVIHDPIPLEDGGMRPGVARFAKEDIIASAPNGGMVVGTQFVNERDGKRYQISVVKQAPRLVEMTI